MERQLASDVSQIYALWKAYGDAATTGDLENWLSLWSQDGIRMASNAPRSVGLEAIREAIAPVFELFDLEINVSPDEVRILGNHAFTYGAYEMALTPKAGGDTIEDNGKFLTILVQEVDGSWKIAIDCFNTNLPAPS